jgi:hypothetical protein
VLTNGLVSLAAVALVASFASFAVDFLLHPPQGVRAVLLLGGLVGLTAFFVRRVLRPLSAPVSDEDLALLVEERQPRLQQLLVTAVQLSRPESEASRYVSAQLLGAVIADLEKEVGSIPWLRIVRLRHFTRRVGLLALLAVAAVAGAASRGDFAGTWLRRNLFLSSEPWPKDTQIAIHPPPPFRVAMGDHLPISVRVLRGTPRSVTVEWSTVSEDGEDGRGSDEDAALRRVRLSEVREAASWDVLVEDLGPEPERVGELLKTRRVESSALESLLSAGRGAALEGLGAADAEELRAALAALGVRVETVARDVFVHEFQHVNHAFEFWVEGGDDRVGPYRVDVLLRPRIDMQTLELTYQFPAYTGLRDRVNVQRHGNLKVPAGTDVRFRMAANIPVTKAYFVLREFAEGEKERSEPSGEWPAPGAVDLLIEESRRFSGAFVARKSGYYFFQFENAQGFRSVQPEKFRIQTIPDRKPEIQITEPARASEEVTPEAQVLVRVAARDDHGIHRASVQGAYLNPSGEQRVPQEIALPALSSETPEAAREKLTRSEGKLETEFVLKVAAIQTDTGSRPVPGSRFEFYALAEDFGAVGDRVQAAGDGAQAEGSGVGNAVGNAVGNIGESQVFVLQIVDRESVERVLTNRLMVLRDQLREIQGRQVGARRDLEAFQRQATVAVEIQSREAAKISRHRQDQQKIGDGLDRQVAEAERILQKMEANAVGDDEWRNWLGGIRDEIQRIAERQSEKVVADFDTLRKDLQSGPQPSSRIAPMTAMQRQIERDIGSLVSKLTEHGDLSSVIEDLRRLREKQASLRDRTRERIGSEGGKEPQK